MRPAELTLFKSLAEQTDARPVKPDGLEQRTRAVGKQVECTLGEAVLPIRRNETLQSVHAKTHIHGLLVEVGYGVMWECEHIPPSYSPRL